MDTVNIQNIEKYEGKIITIKGWVYSVRSIGKVWFLIIRDGTGLLQGVVVKNEVDSKIFELEQKINQEDSVIISGLVRKEDRSVGGFEISIDDISIVNSVIEEYPISPKEHGTDFLMTNRHLWLRSKRQNAIIVNLIFQKNYLVEEN